MSMLRQSLTPCQISEYQIGLQKYRVLHHFLLVCAHLQLKDGMAPTGVVVQYGLRIMTILLPKANILDHLFQ